MLPEPNLGKSELPKMTTIYCLMHSYDSPSGEPEDKILAYFATKQEAEDAIQHYAVLPGFSRHPDGFLVDGIQLGKLHWEQGFETLLDNEPI